MVTRVELQNDSGLANLPELQAFTAWVEAALQSAHAELEQTVRIVAEEESRQLNRRYRGKDRATNVLAFPADSDLLEYDCLGDLVICAPLVESEARTQRKSAEAHWAHLVVHGMLHLQGYDHRDDTERALMEALEIKILDGLGYANPYND